MCSNEFYSDTLKFPQMNLTDVKTIANNANNSGSNGFDGDNEENEDTNGDYVNGGIDQYDLCFSLKFVKERVANSPQTFFAIANMPYRFSH